MRVRTFDWNSDLWLSLLCWAQCGSDDAAKTVVTAMLPLVYKLAKSDEDEQQEAVLAVYDAIKKYDGTTKWGYYCQLRIKWRLGHYHAQLARYRRELPFFYDDEGRLLE